MRAAWWVVIVLGACDFSPPPAPGAAPAVAPAAGSAAGSAGSDVTPDCIAVADHLVGLAIEAIPSANEQAVQRANRAKNVHLTAETCTKASWSPGRLRCLIGAATQADAGACMTGG